MNTEAFFARVHRCLDARQDALDDAELVAFLHAHPELLPEFAALSSDVRALAQRARPIVRKHRWPWLAAAAALIVTAAAIAWPDRAPRNSQPRILAASLEELRPRAHVAASYCVRQALVATATTSFETFEYRSEPR